MIRIHDFGKQGEQAAKRYLQQGLGYSILALNFRSRFGEIDIVAQEKDTVVFVEVKTRKNTVFGQPIEAVGPRKLEGLIQTGYIFLRLHNKSTSAFRFDVIEVLTATGDTPHITHTKNVTL